MDTTHVEAASAARRPLSIVYKPTDSLIPDPRNARTHPKRQIGQIVASIRAFGFTNPILADPAGNLIAGHGRLRAAKEMGLAEVPVIEVGGLSESQKKALRLADNKIALNAGWDIEIFKLELADLSLPGIADQDPGLPVRWKVHAWATQAALSRPGRRTFTDKEVKDIKFFTWDAETLRWPRGRLA